MALRATRAGYFALPCAAHLKLLPRMPQRRARHQYGVRHCQRNVRQGHAVPYEQGVHGEGAHHGQPGGQQRHPLVARQQGEGQQRQQDGLLMHLRVCRGINQEMCTASVCWCPRAE